MMFFKEQDQEYNIKTDEVSSSVTYIGESDSNNDGSGAVWRIRKSELVGTVTTISYADGSKLFNKVWNDRTGYSY